MCECVFLGDLVRGPPAEDVDDQAQREHAEADAATQVIQFAVDTSIQGGVTNE